MFFSPGLFTLDAFLIFVFMAIVSIHRSNGVISFNSIILPEGNHFTLPPHVAILGAPQQAKNCAPENEATDQPSTVEWSPSQEYRETQICQLMGGPGEVTFKGRIVNYFTAGEIAARRHYLPRGNHFLVIKDNTGVIAVSFWVFMRYRLPQRMST